MPNASSGCATRAPRRRWSRSRQCAIGWTSFEEIDLAEIDAVRAGWPFFRDRRIDAYADITKRFGNDERSSSAALRRPLSHRRASARE